MRPTRVPTWRSSRLGWLQAGAAAVGLVALVWLRTRGITESMWLYGDQVRDWRFALGSWRDLPLAGPPSSIGGTGLGPAFYWLLWLIRQAIGPWTGNLPHAGGIGIAVVQSIGDAVLFVAIWRRLRSPLIAFGVVLIVATNPFDLAISGTIWNPPAGVAFVKLAMAMVLWSEKGPSLARAAGAAALAWMAVQCHSGAIFLAIPLILAFPAREIWAGRRGRAAAMLAVTAGVVATLQVPLLLNAWRRPAARSTSPLVVDSVKHAIAHPGTIHVARSFQAIAGAFRAILALPLSLALFDALLVACVALTLVRVRRDPALLSITVAPLVLVVCGFVTWDRPFETHWFFTLAPALVLTIALAVTWVPWPAVARAGAVALVAIGIAAVPSRVRQADTLFRMPEYGALVQGSRDIVRRTRVLRAVRVSFDLPPSLPPEFLFQALGGRISTESRFIATIGPGGRVTYAELPD